MVIEKQLSNSCSELKISTDKLIKYLIFAFQFQEPGFKNI